jgi:hypothetical protein
MNKIRARIDSVITAGIAPFLKGKEFTQRKRYFYRDNVNCISVVNIQASKWDRGSKGEFTINLGVYFPDVADIMDSIQFTGLPKIEDCTVENLSIYEYRQVSTQSYHSIFKIWNSLA